MIISNNPMYKNMQQTHEKEEHGSTHNHDEHKDEHVEQKDSELETTNVSSDSMMAIAKMVASMIESTTQSHDIKCIYDKLHELDKRLSVNEALILHITNH